MHVYAYIYIYISTLLAFHSAELLTALPPAVLEASSRGAMYIHIHIYIYGYRYIYMYAYAYIYVCVCVAARLTLGLTRSIYSNSLIEIAILYS